MVCSLTSGLLVQDDCCPSWLYAVRVPISRVYLGYGQFDGVSPTRFDLLAITSLLAALLQYVRVSAFVAWAIEVVSQVLIGSSGCHFALSNSAPLAKIAHAVRAILLASATTATL